MNIERFFHGRDTQKLALAVALAAYAVMGWFFIELAISVHTPCKSDFEGGCSYGKVWAGALSWLAAWAAVSPAAGVAAFSSAVPRFKTALIGLSVLLAAPPFAYVIYGIYKIAPVVVELLM